MKWIATITLLLSLTGGALAAGTDDQYLDILGQIIAADTLQEGGHPESAALKYRDAQAAMQRLQTDHPGWNTTIVKYRLDYLDGKMKDLAQYLPAALAAAPTSVNTNLSEMQQLASLQDEVNTLTAANAQLQQKVKEALTVQPAAVAPGELAKAQESIHQLEKQRDLLQAALDEQKKAVAKASAPAADNSKKLSDELAVLEKQSSKDSAAAKAQISELKRQLDDAKEKLAKASTESHATPTRPSPMPAPAPAPMAPPPQPSVAVTPTVTPSTPDANASALALLRQKEAEKPAPPLAPVPAPIPTPAPAPVAPRPQTSVAVNPPVTPSTPDVNASALALLRQQEAEKQAPAPTPVPAPAPVAPQPQPSVAVVVPPATSSSPDANANALALLRQQEAARQQEKIAPVAPVATPMPQPSASYDSSANSSALAVLRQQETAPQPQKVATMPPAAAPQVQPVVVQPAASSGTDANADALSVLRQQEKAPKPQKAAPAPVPAPAPPVATPQPAPPPSSMVTPANDAANAAALSLLRQQETTPSPAPAPVAAPAAMQPSPAPPVAVAYAAPAPDTAAPARAHSVRDLPAGAGELMADALRAASDHDYVEAEKKFSQVLEQDPNNVYVLVNLGNAQFAEGHLEDCEKNVNHAIALDSNDAGALYLLGILRFRQERLDDALDALSRSATINSTNASTQNYLGRVLAEKGQRPKAEAAFRKALASDPQYADAHFNLALIYSSETPPSMALANLHYQQALRYGHPRNGDLEKLLAGGK